MYMLWLSSSVPPTWSVHPGHIEGGLNIDRFNDIKVGDVVEAYEEVEVKQKLED